MEVFEDPSKLLPRECRHDSMDALSSIQPLLNIDTQTTRGHPQLYIYSTYMLTCKPSPLLPAHAIDGMLAVAATQKRIPTLAPEAREHRI